MNFTMEFVRRELSRRSPPTIFNPSKAISSTTPKIPIRLDLFHSAKDRNSSRPKISTINFSKKLNRKGKARKEINSPVYTSSWKRREKKSRTPLRERWTIFFFRYLTLLENESVYPCLIDEDRVVISLPPLSNSDRTKVCLLSSPLLSSIFVFSWVWRVNLFWLKSVLRRRWRFVVEWWMNSSKKFFVLESVEMNIFFFFNKQEFSTKREFLKQHSRQEQISTIGQTFNKETFS